MEQDYIKLSRDGIEATGRCALPALYGVIGLRAVTAICCVVTGIVVGPQAAASVIATVARLGG